MKTIPIRIGPNAEIVAIVENNGKCPLQDFLEGLTGSDRNKVFQLFLMFCQLGEIRNKEKFRKEDDPIWCFKSYQVRIPCFFQPTASKRCLVLTHGFLKKQDKMPKAQIDRAIRYYQQYISR
jgi:putative SOS response-associated peptidase YedK